MSNMMHAMHDYCNHPQAKDQLGRSSTSRAISKQHSVVPKLAQNTDVFLRCICQDVLLDNARNPGFRESTIGTCIIPAIDDLRLLSAAKSSPRLLLSTAVSPATRLITKKPRRASEKACIRILFML
jgi:hypothetical protein